MKFAKYLMLLLLVVFSLCIESKSENSLPGNTKPKEIVYVPAYSSIYHGNLVAELNLAITLSIHNIDAKNKITIDSIDYYNTKGKMIHAYIKDNKIILEPMETYNLGIKESDVRGGVGANFIVKWHAETNVNKPIVETVMIGTMGQQGISFTSRGTAIENYE